MTEVGNETIHYPTVIIEPEVGKYVSNLEIQLLQCGELLSGEGFSGEDIKDLTINPRVNPPESPDFLSRQIKKYIWQRSIGTYDPDEKTIYLNVPMALKDSTWRDPNGTLLHEIGHAVDHFNGKSLQIEPPTKRELRIARSALVLGTVSPSSFTYIESNNLLLTGGAILAAFVGSSAICGAFLARGKDVASIPTRKELEINANEFEAKYENDYPTLITLE